MNKLTREVVEKSTGDKKHDGFSGHERLGGLQIADALIFRQHRAAHRMNRQWEFLSWMFVTNSKRVLLQTRFRRRGRLENAESFGSYWSIHPISLLPGHNRLSGSELNIKYVAWSRELVIFLIVRVRPSSHTAIVYNFNKLYIAIRAAHVAGYALVFLGLAARGLWLIISRIEITWKTKMRIYARGEIIRRL